MAPKSLLVNAKMPPPPERIQKAERPSIASADDPRPRPPRRRKRFVLFGDSITQQSFAPGGWGARLADAYARRADVVLRGYSGYNTEWALSLVPEVFLHTEDDDDGSAAGSGGGGGGGGEGTGSRRPNALVTIFFGANDAALPDRSSARQHVPLERFKRNLAQLARAALGTVEPGGLVVIVSCPPVDEVARARKLAADQGGEQDPAVLPPLLPLPERTNEAARAYSRAAAEVAESLSSSSSSPADAAKTTATAATEPPRVAFLDLWEELGGASFPTAGRSGDWDRDEEKGDPRRLFSDGLHLSELGSLRVFGSVAAAIAEHRPHLSAAELPLDFPDHSEMEPCPR